MRKCVARRGVRFSSVEKVEGIEMVEEVQGVEVVKGFLNLCFQI